MLLLSGWLLTSQSTSSLLRRALSFYATPRPAHPRPVDQGSMRRQKETCEILFSNTSIPIIIDERLRQIDNGPQYTGMNFDVGKRDYLAFIDKPFPKASPLETSAKSSRDPG